MSNIKKYNIFIFFSTFSKTMIEIFLPIFIFNYRQSIKDVLYFYLVMYFFTTLFIPIISILSRKLHYKSIIFISYLFFYFSIIILNKYQLTNENILLISISYSLYLLLYWVGRHFYALKIIENKKVTNSVSSFMIVGVLAMIPAALIGSIILDKFSFLVLLITIIILNLISIIPLYFIKFKKEGEKKDVSFLNIINTFPKKSYLFLIFEQLKFISVLLFPLYIYLYVVEKLNFIGIINLFMNLSSIICVYLLSKKMDKNKKDYLSILSVLLAVVWIFKINTNVQIFLLLIVFLEGIFKTSLETTILRNIYCFGKNYNELYIYFIEFIKNFSRVVFIALFLMFNSNIKFILYLGVLSLIITSVLKFDAGKYGYKKR